MIGLTRLVTGRRSPSDRYRYGSSEAPSRQRGDEERTVTRHRFADDDGHHPVVVWNITESCNLECAHCYYSAVLGRDPVATSFDDIARVIDDLAEARVPVLLLSGGEPLIRKDIHDIAAYARSKGINPVISTNGTIITRPEHARKLRESGVEYVGISVDGMAERHDAQRRKEGAFDRTRRGIELCREAGLRVSMRFTVTAANVDDLPAVLNLAEEVGIDRFCLYHLVPSGRGKRFGDIDNATRRRIIEHLCEQAPDRPYEILTVDNPSDGPVIHQWALEHRPDIADEVLDRLRSQGGDGTGRRIVEIDHDGMLHPNQFWLSHTIGNVLEQPFNEIWNPDGDASLDPLVAELRRDEWPLEGACGACNYASLCGGFRARANNATGNLWAEDPSCPLTKSERAADTTVATGASA
ncbi:MAG: radical SAM protein [Thermoleophilia bacterium]|nr:radical SAM protein [Thermoleophilia bacterium]MDH3755838.1 radical SAM protein [Acidimicrobiia bacterium]